MKKPKLMFAFGAHPGNDPQKDPGERTFFQMAIQRAIETATREGRKITVLSEFKISIDPKDYFSAHPDHELSILREWANGEFSRVIKQELEGGIYPRSDWFDWGYAASILRINVKNPSAISFEVEHITNRIIGNTIFEMGYDKNGASIEPEINREARIILHAIISSHLRSREVAAMIREIQIPDGLVFIPRGFAHKNMISKFGSEYEIEDIEGSGCVPKFQSEAIMLSYRRRLSPEELETFALFKIICQHYLNSPELREQKKQLRREKGDFLAYREIMKIAKDLTHQHISDTYTLTLPL